MAVLLKITVRDEVILAVLLNITVTVMSYNSGIAEHYCATYEVIIAVLLNITVRHMWL